MVRILIASILFLVLSINTSFGQNDWRLGYIIKNQGDTIHGFIDNRDSKSNSKKCFFRRNNTAETHVFTPEELLGYRFIDSKFFVSRNIEGIDDGKPIFLEFLLNGKVNVYHFKDRKDRYFIEKNSKMFELKNTEKIYTIDHVQFSNNEKEYLGTLDSLFSDANIQSDIQKSKLNSRSLINIAKKYHEKVCTDEKCVVYEMSVKPMHVNLGLHTGLSLNAFNFGGETSSNYKLGGLFGGRLEFENVIAWSEKISFVLDFTVQRFSNYKLTEVEGKYSTITYNNNLYALDNKYRDNGSIKSLDADVKTIALKIPFTVNYTFSKAGIRPYIGGGILNMFVLSQNKDFIYQSFYQEFNKSIPTYHVGLTGKVGSKKVLNNKQSIYLELAYEYSQSMNINRFLQFTNNSVSIITGYSF